jgi:hypothetical protein
VRERRRVREKEGDRDDKERETVIETERDY